MKRGTKQIETMTTVIQAAPDNGYAIPQKQEHDKSDCYEVSVHFSNRKTRCYVCSNTKGWQERIRRFVKRAYKEEGCDETDWRTPCIWHVIITRNVNGREIERRRIEGREIKWQQHPDYR